MAQFFGGGMGWSTVVEGVPPELHGSANRAALGAKPVQEGAARGAARAPPLSMRRAVHLPTRGPAQS